MSVDKYYRNFVWLLSGCFLLYPLLLSGQTNGYYVQFSDKAGTPYSLDSPLEFLSQRALDRRMAQGIPLDVTDLPVSPGYIRALEEQGIKVLFKSKWLNGVVAISNNSAEMEALGEWPFVDFVELTYIGEGEALEGVDKRSQKKLYPDRVDAGGREFMKSSAMYSDLQIEMVKGSFLHGMGYNGKGIHIAVLDAGFSGVDVSDAFAHLYSEGLLLGVKNFVLNDTEPIYHTHTHGAQVLGVMTGQVPGNYLGTATEASYWLMRTEDERTEFLIEADYWVCAAEMADSAGVDIIQSSLGYFMFDDPAMNYSFAVPGGQSRISRAASLAFQKGMVVVNSAGNERKKIWESIVMPCDAPEVLAVGALKPDGSLADFSSRGYVVDGWVKPDVMALGWQTAIITQDVMSSDGYGTSFAAPMISGMTACLWQSMPDKTAAEIVNLIRSSADRYLNPDADFGYGLPNFERAYQLGVASRAIDWVDHWQVAPNPFIADFEISGVGFKGVVVVELINLYGQVVWKQEVLFRNAKRITPGVALQPGVYVLRLKDGESSYSTKVIRLRGR